MSVGQIITQLKSLSRNDLVLIVNEAQKTLHELDPIASNHLDLSKMPKNPEIWSPWDEYQAADDMERLLAEGKL